MEHPSHLVRDYLYPWVTHANVRLLIPKHGILGGMVSAGDDDDNTLKDQEDDGQLFLKVNPKYENKKVDFKLSHCKKQKGRRETWKFSILYDCI